MQEKLLPDLVALRLVDSENPGTLGIEQALAHQVFDRPSGTERRVQLNKRLGPKRSCVQGCIDELGNSRISNLDEAARVASVVRDQSFPELEDVQIRPSANSDIAQ